MRAYAKKIYERYQKGYVTDEQLEMYFELEAITQKEHDEIKESKSQESEE